MVRPERLFVRCIVLITSKPNNLNQTLACEHVCIPHGVVLCTLYSKLSALYSKLNAAEPYYHLKIYTLKWWAEPHCSYPLLLNKDFNQV